MVAGKEMNWCTAVTNVGQNPQGSNETFGNSFLVFEPKIEIISHEENHGSLFSDRLQPMDEEQLALFVVL